jgi:hypothetical protein
MLDQLHFAPDEKRRGRSGFCASVRPVPRRNLYKPRCLRIRGDCPGTPRGPVSGPQPSIPLKSVQNPSGPCRDGNLGQIQIGRNTTADANLVNNGGDPGVMVGVTTRF